MNYLCKILIVNIIFFNYTYAQSLVKDSSEGVLKQIFNYFKNIGPDWSITILTAILAFVTTILAIYTWKLWKATNQTVKDNKELAINQLRAYMGICQSNFCGWKDNEDSKILILYDLVNHGQTVATNINITGTICVAPYPLPDTHNFNTELISQKLGAVIFPNQKKKSNFWF